MGGTDPGQRPLRVAIVGAGPSAFYAAEALLKQSAFEVAVDMFERLPTPYGLVRYGVAPDHPKIKTVVRAFAETASDARFRFFGNVKVGADVTVEELKANYHEILFATGALSDRKMNIPGEDLRGSHAATEFVAWYNGHPDFQGREFDLSHERVVIVGMGNVALDVARILCLDPVHLRAGDMSERAIEALSQSKVREVWVVGRRGPVQAAFTSPELKEFGELDSLDVVLRKDEVELDALSQEEAAGSTDKTLGRKLELLQTYLERGVQGRPRQLHIRFLLSPSELVDDGSGRVGAVRFERNRLQRASNGTMTAEPTGETEVVDAGLVFRSVGYRGVPIEGVPFDDRWGVILNRQGRIVGEPGGEPIPGLYVAGWIKRGPSGVIGTNKLCAVETVDGMLADAGAGRTLHPQGGDGDRIERILAERGCRVVSFHDWQRLDALEVEAGADCGRPRVKFGSVAEMLAAISL